MFFMTKLSLAAILTVIITLFLETLDILDEKYSHIILFGIGVIQIVFLAIFIIIVIIKKRRMNGVKIIRYQLHDTMVKGETDILPENMSPTNPRKSAMFKIFLEIENISETPEIGIYKMSLGRVVPNIKDYIVNINFGKVDNNFIFNADVMVGPDEKINFQIKKDTIIKLFFLGEIYLP